VNDTNGEGNANNHSIVHSSDQRAGKRDDPDGKVVAVGAEVDPPHGVVDKQRDTSHDHYRRQDAQRQGGKQRSYEIDRQQNQHCRHHVGHLHAYRHRHRHLTAQATYTDRHRPSWWRSIIVRMSVLAGELSLSCARLMDDRLTTLWVKHPLSVNQQSQLSLPSLRGRL